MAESFIPVLNPFFESGTPLNIDCSTYAPGCAYNYGGADNWTITGGGRFKPANAPADYPNIILNSPPPDGSQTIAWTPGGYVTQTLSGVFLLPGQYYFLRVDVGYRKDQSTPTDDITLSAGPYSATTHFVASNYGGFERVTASFATDHTVPANTPLTITFTNVAGGQGLFDNVTLSFSPTPEPFSAGLVALGIGVCVLYRNRRKALPR